MYVDKFLTQQAAMQLYPYFDLVLLKKNSKQPQFKLWQEHVMDRSTLQIHLRRWEHNLGILLGNCRGPPGKLCCADVDGEAGQLFAEQHGLTKTGLIARSPNGRHFYLVHTLEEMRTRIRFLGLPLDIKMTGFMCCPPSVVDECRYEWESFHPENIGLFNAEVLKLEEQKPIKIVADTREATGKILHPESYCLRVPSVMGQNGSRGLVRVCAVMRDTGKSPEETFRFIKEVWGPKCCVPEWSEAEIWHCIRRHFNAVER